MPAFPVVAIGGINEEDSSSLEDYGVLANTFGRGLAKKVIGPIKSNDKQNRVRGRKTTLTTMKKMMQREAKARAMTITTTTIIMLKVQVSRMTMIWMMQMMMC